MKQSIASLVAVSLFVQQAHGTIQWEAQKFRALLNAADQPSNACPSWGPATPKDLHVKANKGVCLPADPNVFGVDGGLASVPFPHSAYHYLLDDPLFTYQDLGNGVDPPSVSSKPRVTITTIKSTATDKNTFVTVPSDERAYHWQDFEENRNARVWSRVSAKSSDPGVYKVQLKAHDYHATDSGVCELCFTVTDHYRPRSSNVCPAKPVTPALEGWTPMNRQALVTYLTGVAGFADSRGNNDKCATTSEETCDDTLKNEPKDWFGCDVHASDKTKAANLKTLLTVDFAQGAYGAAGCVAQKLATNPFECVDTLQNPVGSLKPEQCTRKVEFDYTWRENWFQYTCKDDTAAIRKCSSGADADGGDESGAGSNAFTCANSVSLSATAADLVGSVAVSRQAKLSENKQFIADPYEVFKEESYNSDKPNQIHFWSPTSGDQDGDLDVRNPITVAIQDLLVTKATNGKIDGLTLPANAENRVWWRWTSGPVTATSKWHDYSSNDSFQLTNLETLVTLEAWTHCGRVGNPIEWKVYNHRHQSIQNVDEWFQTKWSYASKPRCNVPHSDFGVVKFDFDLDSLNELIVDLDDKTAATDDKKNGDHAPPSDVLLDETVHVNWAFSRVSCAWKYGDPTAKTDFTLSSYSWWADASDFKNTGKPADYTSKTFEFAPKLLNTAVTKVTVFCDFLFSDTLNTDAVVVFQHPYNQGERKPYSVGAYNLPKGFQGAWDGVSSITVEPGYKITLFSEENQQGESITFTADAPFNTLNAAKWGDKAKSLRVDVNLDVVTVFQHFDYDGQSKAYPVGSHNLPETFEGYNGLSSLKIGKGYKVTLFEELNQQGSSYVVTADTKDLPQSPGWNDKAKSLKVEALPGTNANKIANTVHIHTNKNFVFENCDVPNWSDVAYPDGDICVGQCKNTWDIRSTRQAAPFQASKGNLIYPAKDWKQGAATPVATVFHTDANYACCDSCDNAKGFGQGKTAQQVAVFDKSSISRCEPGNFFADAKKKHIGATTGGDGDDVYPKVLAATESTGAAGTMGSLSGVGALVALAAVGVVALVVVQSRSKAAYQRVGLDDAYTSLTDA